MHGDKTSLVKLQITSFVAVRSRKSYDSMLPGNHPLSTSLSEATYVNVSHHHLKRVECGIYWRSRLMNN